MSNPRPSMPAARSRPKKGPWRRAFVISLRIAIGLAVLGLIALVTAVYVARSSLPSYEQLKSSPNGQMIRVFADDGTLLVSLGPSYGEWLSYNQIPQVMRDAMVSVEDRRFRSHIGVDPIGVARSAKVRLRYRPVEPGRIDHHPAAGAQHLPVEHPHLRPQGPRDDPGDGDGAQIHQGPDPRALSQQGLFRRRRLRHRCRARANSSAIRRAS